MALAQLFSLGLSFSFCTMRVCGVGWNEEDGNELSFLQRPGLVTGNARTRPDFLTPLQAADPRPPAKAEWNSGRSSDTRMRERAVGARCASRGQRLRSESAASSTGTGILNTHVQIESNPLPSHVALAGNFVSLRFTGLHCKMG